MVVREFLMQMGSGLDTALWGNVLGESEGSGGAKESNAGIGWVGYS